MKAKSIQQKGKRFEKDFSKLVENMGLGMARRESGSGNGLRKGDIAWAIHKTAELKNQPSAFPKKLLEWIEQAERQDIGHYGWVLILRDPRKPESAMEGFAILDMRQYLELELAGKEPKSKEPDRELKRKIERLGYSASAWLKIVEARNETEEMWKLKRIKQDAKDVIKLLDYKFIK